MGVDHRAETPQPEPKLSGAGGIPEISLIGEHGPLCSKNLCPRPETGAEAHIGKTEAQVASISSR